MPSGQTSLVKTETNSYQVQTEYSYRPFPRVKTTVFNSGQVVHKLEKKLAKPIDSLEEQDRIEDIIRNQHREVVTTIREHNDQPVETQSASEGKKEMLSLVVSEGKLSVKDQLEAVDGVKQVFCLTKEGEFVGSDSAEQFKKSYKAVFKNIAELLQIFGLLPGFSSERETGVYEIERNQLYLASAGRGFYIVATELSDSEIDFEKTIKQIVSPSAFIEKTE